MVNPPRRINTGTPPSRQATKMDRILIDTSDKVAELARRWKTTKQEVYRWLVDLAIENKIEPPDESQPVEAGQERE